MVIRARSFNKVALKTDVDSKLTSSRDLGIEPGDEGITLSRLAPIGKARIKGITVEAKSMDELIDEYMKEYEKSKKSLKRCQD